MPQKQKLDLQPLDLQPEGLDLQPLDLQPVEAPAQAPEIVNQGAGQVARDLLTGAVKGVGNTLGGLSPALNKIPYIGETLAPQQGITALQGMTTPEGTAQKLGFYGEQAGEYLLPAGLEEKAAAGLAKVLPSLGRFASPVARTAVQGLSTGAISGLQGSGFGTGAAVGAGSGAIGELGRAVAPQLAETALRISDNLRGRGRTIGNAVLNDLKSSSMPALAREGQAKSLGLTKVMESNVHAATQQGVVGSTTPAHQALDEVVASIPRNAKDLSDKIESLRSVLDFGSGPQRQAFTPDELLEIKRGIGKTIATWPPEWRKQGDILRAKERLYGAIDSELDRLVPGNAQINQAISSIIPATQQAKRISEGAKLPQRVFGRIAARTGGLAGGIVAGEREGGVPGAIAGGAVGAMVPELISEPAAQLALARLLKSGIIPKVGGAVAIQAFKDQNNKR